MMVRVLKVRMIGGCGGNVAWWVWWWKWLFQSLVDVVTSKRFRNKYAGSIVMLS